MLSFSIFLVLASFCAALSQGVPLLCTAGPLAPVTVWAGDMGSDSGLYRCFLFASTDSVLYTLLGSTSTLLTATGGSFVFPLGSSAPYLRALIVPLSQSPPWGSATEGGPAPPTAPLAPAPIPQALLDISVQQASLTPLGSPAQCRAQAYLGGTPLSPVQLMAALAQGLSAIQDTQPSASPAVPPAAKLPSAAASPHLLVSACMRLAGLTALLF